MENTEQESAPLSFFAVFVFCVVNYLGGVISTERWDGTLQEGREGREGGTEREATHRPDLLQNRDIQSSPKGYARHSRSPSLMEDTAYGIGGITAT